MNKVRLLSRTLVVVGAISAASLTCSPAFAGAYHLFREYNAVELGNSGAGGAALAEDASTAYANPAGLVRIKKPQIVVSGDGVIAHSRFQGTNTWSSSSPTLPFTYTQTGDTSSNVSSLVPALYFAAPLNYSFLPKDRLTFGFSVTVPFGLSTRYPSDSLLRYSGTTTKLSTVDLSPSLGIQVTKSTSLGVGVDFEHFAVDQRKFTGAPLLGSTARDSLGRNYGDGWGYGAHAGILYEYNDHTRVGLTYHSLISSTLTGKSVLKGPILTTIPTRQVSTDTLRSKLILPPSIVLSGHHEFASKWTVDGTVMYTAWSTLGRTLKAYNVAGFPVSPPANATPITSTLQLHYKNSWTFALGGSYRFNPAWLVRYGVSYDQSPVKSAYRNITLPDANKIGLSIGGQYVFNDQVSIDAGYTHLFVQDVNVSTPLALGTQTSVSRGVYDESRVDLIGIQLNYNFA